MKNKKVNKTEPFHKTLLRYLVITFGCFVYALGTVLFIKNLQIVSGGVTGMLNLVNIVHEIPIGVCYFIVNIPLIIISLIVFGWRFSFGTIYGMLMESLGIALFEHFFDGFILTDNMMISIVCGGILLGVGLGLVMMNNASTGGTDIIMKIIHRKKPFLSGGTINTIIDVAILIAYLIIVKNFDMFIYATVVIIIENIVYDRVLIGNRRASKTIYIITNNSEAILDCLINKIGAGVTVIKGIGGYTSKERDILLCVAKNTVFPEIKKSVKELDKSAFMIVCKSYEIYGEGYQDIQKDIL